MWRRVGAAAVMVVAAAVTGSGAAAAAAAPTLQPAVQIEFCREPPPVQMGSQMLVTKIDPGPSKPMNGPYGQYGYAGYQQVVYDPGCTSAIMNNLKRSLPPALQAGVDVARPGAGSSTVAGKWMTGALFVTACTVGLVRLAFGEHPIWRVLDPATESIRGMFGIDLFSMWLCVSIVAMGLFIAAKRALALTAALEYVARAAAIVAVAVGFLAWTGQAGPALDRGIAAAYTYATQLPGEEAPPDAGSAVGDALVSHVIAPIWAEQHLGFNPDTNKVYQPAFQATMAFDRDTDRSVTDPGERADRVKYMQGAFRAVATRLKQDHPDTYPRLASSEDSDRGMLGFVAFLGALNVAVVVVVLTAVVAGFRLAVRVLTNLSAAIALVTMYPTLQGAAFGLARFLGRWAFASVVATAGFVVYVQAFVQGVAANSGVSVGTRVTAMSCVTAVLVAAFKFRKTILGWLRIGRDIDATKGAAKKARERFEKRYGYPEPVSRERAGGESTLRPDPLVREQIAARKTAGDAAVRAVVERQRQQAAQAVEVRRRATQLTPASASTNPPFRVAAGVAAESAAMARAAASRPVKRASGTVAVAAARTAASAMKVPVPVRVKVMK